MGKLTKVLIVEDDPIFRKLLKRVLTEDRGFEVVGAAKDPYEARELLIKKGPEVMILDIHLPKMNGIEFLQKVMEFYPTKTVIFSSAKDPMLVIESIASGALDFIEKPIIKGANDLQSFSIQFVDKLKVVTESKTVQFKKHKKPGVKKLSKNLDRNIILIGSSTGGIEVLVDIFNSLDREFPPIVVVQHILASYVESLALHLSKICQKKVSLTQPGLKLENNNIYLAANDTHTRLIETGGSLRFQLEKGNPVNNVIPSIDVLFESATMIHRNVVAALLTGMGRDGAQGLLQLKNSGAWTICQNESTSTVFGMPKVAMELGAHCEQLPPSLLWDSVFKKLK